VIHIPKAKAEFCLVQFKRGSLLFFFLIIFFSAHSFWSCDSFFRGLSLLGSDIAMTPVTPDMALMLESHETLYTSQMSLDLLLKNRSIVKLSLREQSFYEIKLPLLLMMDLYRYGLSVKLHQRALCWQLKRKNPELVSFNLKSFDTSQENLGLNRAFLCQ
jgi:hypothetical protein